MTVTVNAPVKQTIYLKPGGKKTLRFYQVKNKEATFRVAPEGSSVVSVDEKGTVRALSVGSAEISVSYGGFDFSALVCVEDLHLTEAEGLNWKKAYRYTLTMKNGETLPLSFVNDDSFANFHNEKNHSSALFLSRKPAVAYVDETGTVHALSRGSTSLRYRAGSRDLVIDLKVE